MKPSVLFAGSVILFFVLFFGFSKIAPEVRNPEKSGSIHFDNKDLTVELNSLKDSLSEGDKAYLAGLESELASASQDSSRIQSLQKISSFWYQQGRIGFSAEYAVKIAQIFPTGESWSIAAANLALAAKTPGLAEEKISDYITRSKAAFIQAGEADPGNISHKLNYALLATEYPSADNPMEGILTLRKLNEDFPEDLTVLYHLARLAIQTGQWDRAKERLETLFKLDPGNARAACLMVQISQHDGEVAKAAEWQKKCDSNQ
ncbi:MAG TPA: tetratricopeptide repeat protein [Saprospiraceae bacterium]|nr:tetratricopeptide repeat protein [Saprospiraceae bacterium]HNT21490.1 tetratricopeptide repeat protein [Saprospiraceae bacterium]